MVFLPTLATLCLQVAHEYKMRDLIWKTSQLLSKFPFPPQY